MAIPFLEKKKKKKRKRAEDSSSLRMFEKLRAKLRRERYFIKSAYMCAKPHDLTRRRLPYEGDDAAREEERWRLK